MPELIAGASGADTSTGADAGRLVIFSGIDGTVVDRLTDPRGAAGDGLGASVAISGDLDGDGLPEVIGGDPGVDRAGVSSVGAVIAFVDETTCLRRDCSTDTSAWTIPGEVLGLRLLPDRRTIVWGAPERLGATTVVYDTLRSEQARDFVEAARCIESNDGMDTFASDAETPPPGGVFFYLVRAENSCPSPLGTGSLGAGTGGVPRAGRECP